MHFLRFELTDDMIEALRSGAGVAAGIDHPNYRVEIGPLPSNVRDSLLADLD